MEALRLRRSSHGRLTHSCFQASILSISKNTDYIDTLRTYINCNYNISETARLCSLHRQSLLYRLEKIEELCGMSLKNHEDLFLLELCLMSYYKEI